MKKPLKFVSTLFVTGFFILIGFGSENKRNDSSIYNENTSTQDESEGSQVENYDSEENNDSENSSSDSYNYCSKHSKMYLPENGCTECMYDGAEEELNKPGGFRDRAMRP